MKNLPANTTRRNNGRKLTIAAAAVAALSFSGCSSLIERATETAVEEGVERAIEADSGEEVELDFDADDGTFSIKTEDGSFSVDGEDGTFVLETEDGTFSAGEGDWELWPTVVARPEFSADPVVGGVEEDGLVWAFANGEVPADAQGAVDAYVATLVGFEVTETSTSEGYAATRLSNGEFRVEVSATDNALSVSVSNG